MRAPSEGAPDGIVLVDKPEGPTSQRVASTIRRLAGTRKVGHAGTLDPMATGLLVVGVGRATKLLGHLTLADKEYTATVRLGASTVTDDAQGDVLSVADAAGVTDADVAASVAELTGTVAQVPSAVSAIKVDGVRAHRLVRAGDDVVLRARTVQVHTFDVDDVRRVQEQGRTVVDVDIRVHVSSGTYVRALARDIGSRLGVGGHLTRLRRTSVGPYRVEQAHTLEALADSFALTPIAEAARVAFPVWEVDADTVHLVRHGAPIPETGVAAGPVAAFGPDGELLALVQDRDGRARYLAVFVA